jgi:hypothetical protein
LLHINNLLINNYTLIIDYIAIPGPDDYLILFQVYASSCKENCSYWVSMSQILGDSYRGHPWPLF